MSYVAADVVTFNPKLEYLVTERNLSFAHEKQVSFA